MPAKASKGKTRRPSIYGCMLCDQALDVMECEALTARELGEYGWGEALQACTSKHQRSGHPVFLHETLQEGQEISCLDLIKQLATANSRRTSTITAATERVPAQYHPVASFLDDTGKPRNIDPIFNELLVSMSERNDKNIATAISTLRRMPTSDGTKYFDLLKACVKVRLDEELKQTGTMSDNPMRLSVEKKPIETSDRLVDTDDLFYTNFTHLKKTAEFLVWFFEFVARRQGTYGVKRTRKQKRRDKHKRKRGSVQQKRLKPGPYKAEEVNFVDLDDWSDHDEEEARGDDDADDMHGSNSEANDEFGELPILKLKELLRDRGLVQQGHKAECLQRCVCVRAFVFVLV
jgi:hypothetical protein